MEFFLNAINIQSFINAINDIATEGTATFISPPSIKSTREIQDEVIKGVALLESIYTNTIVDYKTDIAKENLFNRY